MDLEQNSVEQRAATGASTVKSADCTYLVHTYVHVIIELVDHLRTNSRQDRADVTRLW